MFRQKNFGISRFPAGKVTLLAAALVVAVLIVLAVTRGSAGIDSGTYQLIKLSNGESYIGKLQGISGDYATLGTPFIYKEPASGQGENANNEIQLLRVSSVEGDLRIASDKIIYWGNLPKEGRIVNAIKSADK